MFISFRSACICVLPLSNMFSIPVHDIKVNQDSCVLQVQNQQQQQYQYQYQQRSKYSIKRSQTAIRTLKCRFHFFVKQGECFYKNEGDQQHLPPCLAL